MIGRLDTSKHALLRSSSTPTRPLAAMIGIVLLAGLAAWASSARISATASMSSASSASPISPVRVDRVAQTPPQLAAKITPPEISAHVIAGGDGGGEWQPSWPSGSKPQASSWFVVTSDPQYPWTPFTDGTGGKSNDEHFFSRYLINEQYASINRFAVGRTVVGTFINGDLTAYGHDWQVQFMQGAIKRLTQPVYLGLGNHDYDGNHCHEETCARRSVWWFLQHMRAMKPDAMDVHESFYYWFPSNWYEVRGSLGWSKTFGDVTVIQLNNYPHFSNYLHGWNFGGAYRELLKITPSLSWLEAQLKIAARDRKAVVIMLHNADFTGEFGTLVARYGVSAIFAGHLHKDGGRVGELHYTPVYWSGSASQRTYLLAEKYGNRMSIWSVKGNRPEARELIDDIPLNIAGKPLPPPPLPLPPPPPPEPETPMNPVPPNTDKVPGGEGIKIRLERAPVHGSIKIAVGDDGLRWTE